MARSLHVALLASLLLCAAPRLHAADAPASDDSTVIARIGDTDVTVGEIRAEIQNLDATTQAAAARDPATLGQIVRGILARRLILKEALDKKWDQDPSVTAALARLRDSVIVQTYLQSISTPSDSFPSDAEVQAAYDANKAQIIIPRQYDLSQILISDPKGSDPASSAKAQVKFDSVRKALAKPDADFAAIAAADSDDPPSAAKGGEIGLVAENLIDSQIRSQLGSLTKGGVTPPIRLDDGWHILKVNDIKDPYTPTLAEIRPQLIQRMRAQRARLIGQQYMVKILQDNHVQIDELSLSKVIKQ
jgi:peptidylprolyl isomerase